MNSAPRQTGRTSPTSPTFTCARNMLRSPSPRPARPVPASKKSDTVLPLLAELVSRGDGTYLLKPKVPGPEMDTWITIQQVAKVLAVPMTRNLYFYLGKYLVYRRPLPNRVVISLKSTLAFKLATQDPEFWQSRALRDRLRRSVERIMETMTAEAVQVNDE